MLRIYFFKLPQIVFTDSELFSVHQFSSSEKHQIGFLSSLAVFFFGYVRASVWP